MIASVISTWLCAAALGASPADEVLVLLVPVLVAPDEAPTTGGAVANAAAETVVRHARLVPIIEPEAAALARGCGSNLYCMAAAVGRAGARYALVVNVNLAFEPRSVRVYLVDHDRGGAAAQSSGPVEGAGTSALSDAIGKHVTAALDRAGYPLAGFVWLTVEPPEASVAIHTPTGADPIQQGSVRLPPGTHRLLATADGFAPATTDVIVVAGASMDVRLTLQPEASVLSSPWLWVGIAVGLAAAGGVTAGVLVSQSANRCVCVTGPGVDCPPCPD